MTVLLFIDSSQSLYDLVFYSKVQKKYSRMKAKLPRIFYL